MSFSEASKEVESSSNGSLNVLLIVNPRSGNQSGKRVSAYLKNELEKDGILVHVIFTQRPGHANEILKTKDLGAFSIVALAGGDGTVSEGINGIVSRKDDERLRIVIAVVPLGSGNTFAKDLGITTPDMAMEAIKRRRYNGYDLIKVNDQYYSGNIAGIGASTGVMETANSLRCGCCPAPYKTASYLYIAKNPSIQVRLSWKNPDGTHSDVESKKYSMIQAQVNKHMGNLIPFCPKAVMDDGIFDLIMVDYTSRGNLIALLQGAKTEKHLEVKEVKYVQCCELNMEIFDRGTSPFINIDGELQQTSSTMNLICLKQHIRVLRLE